MRRSLLFLILSAFGIASAFGQDASVGRGQVVFEDDVATLIEAWSFDTGPIGPEPESTSVTTPLMVGGRLFLTAGATRNVVALDAISGQMLWMWRLDEGVRFDAAPRKGSGKGLTYYKKQWPGAHLRDDPRLLFGGTGCCERS